MNSVENLKSTQWRKFFKLFKSSSMQCLNIFGAREGFLFEITSLSGVWKFCKSFHGLGPHASDPFPFDHTGRSPSPARHPCSQWPRSPHDEHSVSVAAGRRHPRGLPPPPYHCTGRHRGSRHPLRLSPPIVRLCYSLLCSTPVATAPTIAHHR
jgi:hypothetical protein